MPSHRAMLVSAITATVLPAFPVYAADSMPVKQPDSTGALQRSIRPVLSQFSFAPGVRPESRSAGLKFETGTAPSTSQTNNHRHGLASATAAGSALTLSRASAAYSTGWRFSGRVGPVRWLTPLEGEGQTAMRFGGRVPGQPRMPGMGLFNLGVHYSFK